MEWTKADYQRLGDKLRAARRELGYRTLKQFQDYLDEMDEKQLSGRTYADIEAGELRKRQRFSQESLAFLEDLFGWAPGVTRSILDGREVDVYSGIYLDNMPAAGWPPAPEGYDSDGYDHLFADIDGRLSKLEEQVRQLELRFRPRRPLAAVEPVKAPEADLSDPDDEVAAAAKEGAIEEPGEFNT